MRPPLTVLVVAALALGSSACVTRSLDGDDGGSPREASQYNVQLGLEYLRQGRRELAFEKLHRALKQAPKSADAHVAIAYAYSVHGEPTLADRHYREALRLDRSNPDIANAYGAFLCDRGRMRDAERQLVKAARTVGYGTPEIAWTNAGMCAERAGDRERAQGFYREALRVNDRHPAALWQLAQLAFDASNPLQSRAFLQRYEAVAPRTAASLWLGYQVERTLGDERAAQVYAARLRSDFADSEQARLLKDAESGRGR